MMLLAVLISAWLQYGSDGLPHARAVVDGPRCPQVLADGRPVEAVERAAPRAAFRDRVCDAVIPARAREVRVGDRALPAPAHDPQTIVVFGDTGCRVSLLQAQSCDDPAAWPFPTTARTVAALHPDLVVHVGDYLYRERSCTALRRCTSVPHGDDAPAWRADWLAPAAPLFAAAPLIVLRGNHEECARNGQGWFRYLDAHPGTRCIEDTEPYAVDLGDLRIVAFDSAIAEDVSVDRSRTPTYRRQFARVHALAAGAREAWFVTHRPPYLNDDERTAIDGALAPFELVLSGHIHFFAALNLTALPPLIINGEGGTALDPDYGGLLGFAAGDLGVQAPIFSSAHFGFGVYTRTPDGWDVSLRDPDGTERARCTIAERHVHCTALAASHP